ncbi:aminodeoxychorismate synthase component I [Sphingomonas sp.]|uniref:aminodeoxychorismate synthase component I n=1 Tax=Sphingomonas sp. TaxID=28214 RepID=UPI00286E1E66|nr:aminodeoxychorismate synthase component I [Sphingomonas sp.]
MPAAPFLLFDDARPGGAPPRLYRNPVGEVVAHSEAEVLPALEQLRAEIASGRHAAGFLAYEAGFALDPALAGKARAIAGPLLWFGLFDGFERARPIYGTARLGPPRPRIAAEAYLAAAAQVREHLFAGDFYQANLTFGCDVTLLGDPLAAYAQLRREALPGWGGVVRHPGGWLLSLSPEQFFTIRNGNVEAKPMKGTAPRFADPAADAAAIAHLRGDPKQRAENLMIVDLLRNDLARIAETGSVEVPALFEVESFPTVHQMVSRVTATLRPGLDAIDVLRTIFPCGSITGAPKISAMLHLRELEPEPRGAYTGSMGWIEPGGDASFNVLIRTLELADGAAAARLGLGSGLVVDSVAADEWAECRLKGDYVTRAADLPDLIETMRFDPEEGVVELPRHFQRLQRSAAELGFTFDHHAARNELQAATFGKKHVCAARLLLSPTGTMAIEVKPIDEPAPGPVEVKLCPLPVATDDARLRHKTSERGFYDDARTASGAFEVVFTDPEGFVTEGSFTNVFVDRGGTLVTPPLSRGLLPGILRASLVDSGKAMECDLIAADLADGFYIGNMLRGLLRARLA